MAAGAISRHAAGAVQLALQDLISDESRGNKKPIKYNVLEGIFLWGRLAGKIF